jgi:hypothetical protein
MRTPILYVTASLFGFCQLASAAVEKVKENDSVVTAVFSSISNGYKREVLGDGTYKPETYVVGNGGVVSGTAPNATDDDVPFKDIVQLMVQHLAVKNYYPARDSNDAKLLLIFSWGKTLPFNDSPLRAGASSFYSAGNDLKISRDAVKQSEAQGEAQSTSDGIQSADRSVADAARDAFEGQLLQTQMFNNMKMKASERNARILGYSQEINNKNNAGRFAGGGTYFNDLIEDIENERYYVIISAYDFAIARDTKQRKLLWATRVSVDARGNRFKDNLVTMLAKASEQFGQDSGQLYRQYNRGKVKLGDLKFLGEAH